MLWQSPIAPGISWYQDSAGERPEYPVLDGSRQTDIAIVGGGFTGLQAAYTLARAGVSVTLIEDGRFGDGASGRNGGQFGTGQRAEPDELEDEYGFERAKALFDLAENAKKYILGFAADQAIDMDFMPGQLNVAHKSGHERDYQKSVEAFHRFGYTDISYMDIAETAERVGSKRFYCGTRDTGTGHIHPLKLVIGLAKAAKAAGADLFEMTRATGIRQSGGKTTIETARGTITADKVLLATNAYIKGLEPVTAAHVMPIRSFIGATVPLDKFPSVIPGSDAIADSRFVVRYWRKTNDGRLLFGGREAYTSDTPRDISEHIRRQIAEIYPELHDIGITHAWGGSVGITMSRKPFAREIMPGVTSVGGFSGHGVMLSNYCGKLWAEGILGRSRELDLIRDLNIGAFPGGSRLRSPLLFLALTYYALRDKF